MKPHLNFWRLGWIFALASAFQSLPASRAADVALWQIGKADNRNGEFALAPNRFKEFKTDGFFVVGESDAQRDWPYAHPGPQDSWAGAKPHTFTVLFSLSALPTVGECRVEFDLIDTHSSGPPTLRLELNSKTFDHTTPPGVGDEVIRGQTARGREHKFAIRFPSSLLRVGDNELRITAVSGSWMLYDAIAMFAPLGSELGRVQSRTVIDEVRSVRALIERDGQLFQPVRITLRHFGEEIDATVRLLNGPSTNLHLLRGSQTAELVVAAVSADQSNQAAVEIGGKKVATRDTTLKPVRKLTVYILPHSHTDIGYTEIQTAIEQKQVQNLVDGLAAAKRTASYPAGARFVWNVEVLWAADLYLRRLDERQRTEFLEAVQRGQVSLNGMYLNELTGLCRPEELVRLFRFATQLAERTGVPIDSVMISDVPGYTWGTVTAMAHAGLRYFSTAPNYFDRIGTILREWENKPFYWVGPDGRSKVLVWIPFWGYAMSHVYGKMSPQLVDDFYEGLEKRDYPFDIAHVRWSGHGDNAIPDPAICEFVRDWNVQYAWPRFVISGTSEAFRALEKRYGEQLPQVRGDWTPYWEDGAGSSALETAMNRASSDRLTQAEALIALLKPSAYRAADFDEAWRHVLLYSEHTWGADESISRPESQKTREQWAIKQGYARAADQQSRTLLKTALALTSTDSLPSSGGVDVWNSLSWPRAELVMLPNEMSRLGDRVTDDRGQPIPSQRLSSGELVFLAQEVPPFAARRFTLSAGSPHVDRRAIAEGHTLDNGLVRVRVDEKTGGIIELKSAGLGNFADTAAGEALNDYLYLPGDDLKDLKRNGPVTIRVGQPGPLVASLVIESSAPGCKKLTRELRVVAGLDYVELINLVDKERLPAQSYHAKEGKESVNFAFPFHVPGGDILLDLPLATMLPDADQMPSACKNWLTVGRWADVSNQESGVTWVSLDAPLIQIGGLTATLLNSQTDPDIWLRQIGRTQKIYSWAMNNHWGTNYRAYQDGPTVFRFVLRPHRRRDPAEATRFATGFSQPLLPARAGGGTSPLASFARITPSDVLVTGMKPSDDGRAVMLRLFGAGSETRAANLTWGARKPVAIFASDTSERAGQKVTGAIEVPAHGLVSLRIEFE